MFDAIGTAYVELGLAIHQHIDGYVDAYDGPQSLRDAAAERGPLPPNALVSQAEALIEAIETSEYPSRRRSYLMKQVQAMATTCRQLAGETLPYLSEVERHFDIVPHRIDDDTLASAIEELETLVPGTGPIQERMIAWRRRFEVTPAIAQRMIDVIVPELRQRTLALYPLPAEESVEFRLVSNQPWSGYNWYHGGFRSTVDINTDLPIPANTLTGLVAHEAYPGHHTEHCLKGLGLLKQRGWAEHSITLLNTPECVIAEGVANVGASVLFAAGELERWQAEVLYPLAGIDGDPLLERRITTATKALAGVGGNAALMLHHEERSPADVLRYLMDFGLSTEERARKLLGFISAPMWRTYIFTYFYGENLMHEWLSRGDRIERYRTLLKDQITPSLLERWVLDERNTCGTRG